MSEHVYLIKRDPKIDVYKVGRTDRGLARLREYGDPEVYLMMRVNDCRACEHELLEAFRQHFTPSYEEHKSVESFKGNILDMQRLFIDIASNHLAPKPKRIDNIIKGITLQEVDKEVVEELQDPTFSDPLERHMYIITLLNRYTPEQLHKYVSNIDHYKDPVNVDAIDVNKVREGKYSYREVQQILRDHFPSKPCMLTKKKVELESDILRLIHLCHQPPIPQRSRIPKTSTVNIHDVPTVNPNERDILVKSVALINKHLFILNVCRAAFNNMLCFNDRLVARQLLGVEEGKLLEEHALNILEQHQVPKTNIDKLKKEELEILLKPVIDFSLTKLKKEELKKLVLMLYGNENTMI